MIVQLENINNDQSFLIKRDYQFYERLYKDPKNISFVKDAMFGSTNEQYGTSYKSRYNDPKYQFAGKTGTSQVKKNYRTRKGTRFRFSAN